MVKPQVEGCITRRDFVHASLGFAAIGAGAALGLRSAVAATDALTGSTYPPFSMDIPTEITVPVYVLTGRDVPNRYKGFLFSTANYPYSRATVTNPKQVGGMAHLPEVGTWEDASGTKHLIDADMTILELLGSSGFYNYNGLFGLRSEDATPGYVAGTTVEISFSRSDGEALPADFCGMLGFSDLDYNENTLEAVMLLDGVDGLVLPFDDMHVEPFGVNGMRGIVDAHNAQTSWVNKHDFQHGFSALFSGTRIIVRYESMGMGYGTIFATPIVGEMLRGDVTYACVDTNGRELRSAVTVSTGLIEGERWNVEPPELKGYRYVRLGAQSAPASGTMPDPPVTQAIVFIYEQLPGNIGFSKSPARADWI